MTQEEKELLFKDLSARLPYHVRCKDTKEFVTQRVAELLRLHGFDGDYPSPTFQEMNDWLETRGYWIVCRPLNYDRVDIYIYATNDDLEWYPFKNFVTPTKYEGFNMALEYVLENLI